MTLRTLWLQRRDNPRLLHGPRIRTAHDPRAIGQNAQHRMAVLAANAQTIEQRVVWHDRISAKRAGIAIETSGDETLSLGRLEKFGRRPGHVLQRDMIEFRNWKSFETNGHFFLPQTRAPVATRSKRATYALVNLFCSISGFVGTRYRDSIAKPRLGAKARFESPINTAAPRSALELRADVIRTASNRSYQRSAARITSPSADADGNSARIARTCSETPLRSALLSIAATASSSRSIAHTWRAPESAAAMATKPHPAPHSATLRPATISG